MTMSTEGHIWVCGSTVAGSCVGVWGRVTAEGRADVYGLSCSLKPCWCLYALLPLGVILIRVVCAVTWGPSWRPWFWLSPRALSVFMVLRQPRVGGAGGVREAGSWSVLSPENMWKPVVCAPANWKEQQATFAVISMAANSQLRKGDTEGFCNNPYPHPNTPSPA